MTKIKDTERGEGDDDEEDEDNDRDEDENENESGDEDEDEDEDENEHDAAWQHFTAACIGIGMMRRRVLLKGNDETLLSFTAPEAG